MPLTVSDTIHFMSMSYNLMLCNLMNISFKSGLIIEKKYILILPKYRMSAVSKMIFYFFKGYFMYLFIFTERGREKEGEKYQCVVASLVHPPLGTRPVPGLGIEPVTPWFTVQRSVH